MATNLIMAGKPEEAAGFKTPSAAYLAGGTEVNRLGSEVSEDTLISLKKCSGLDGICRDNGCVIIGAMCTFQQLVDSDDVPSYLKEAAYFMASRTKRNMATIGGNIAARRSDSYLIATLTAAGAVLELMGPDGKTSRVSAMEYVNEDCTCDDMLITSVMLPEKIRVVSKRYANTAQSHAVLTMSAALAEEGIRLTGVVKNVGFLHFCDLEAAFRGNPEISDDEIIEMVRICTGLHTTDDMFGSDAYKRYLIAVTACDLHRQLAGKEAKR